MKRICRVLVMGIVLLVCPPAAALDVLSPTADGVVLGQRLKVVVSCQAEPELNIGVDGTAQVALWRRLAHRNRWLSEVQLPAWGAHEITLSGRCGIWRVNKELRFTNIQSPVEAAEAVVERFFHIHPVDTLGWNWGEAVFLYGLGHFAPLSYDEYDYVDALNTYHQRHGTKGIGTIKWADKCPPALSALLLEKEYGLLAGQTNLEQVIDYLRSAPRNNLGSLDHLGQDNILAFFMPRAIWVDSLMMWAVLAVQYGLERNDAKLTQFGLEQPLIFANVLRDPGTGLFYHAWDVESGKLFPLNNTFWLRGNGWVLVALAEMLDAIGDNHPSFQALAQLFVDLATAIESYRQDSGYWDTVVAEPGFAYEESSGTALVAYAWAKGARLGLLPARFRAQARDSLQAIVSRLRRRKNGFTMEEISRGTNPSSRWGYRLVLRDRNISYGVGALLLLASELAADNFE